MVWGQQLRVRMRVLLGCLPWKRNVPPEKAARVDYSIVRPSAVNPRSTLFGWTGSLLAAAAGAFFEVFGPVRGPKCLAGSRNAAVCDARVKIEIICF